MKSAPNPRMHRNHQGACELAGSDLVGLGWAQEMPILLVQETILEHHGARGSHRYLFSEGLSLEPLSRKQSGHTASSCDTK